MMSPVVIDSDATHSIRFGRAQSNWIPATNDPLGYHYCNGTCPA